jgi:hypothetical protein
MGEHCGLDAPSRGGRYRLEVRSTGFNKVGEDLCPVCAGVPGDLAGGVYFDGHDLADCAALNDDDDSADTPALPTAVLAALYICDDEGVADI